MKVKLYSGMVICLAGILVLSICGCDGKSKEPVEVSDIDKLQGTWIGSEIGRDGEWTFVFTGDKVEVKGPGAEAYSGAMKLNSDVDPKQADFVIEKCAHEPFVGATSLSIYKIEEGKFTMAGSEPGSDVRPEEFKAGDGTRLFVCTKQVP